MSELKNRPLLEQREKQMNDRKKLYLQIRAGFVSRGSTLTEWCRDHALNPTNVRSAIYGVWDGPKGMAMLKSVCAAAGVVCPNI